LTRSCRARCLTFFGALWVLVGCGTTSSIVSIDGDPPEVKKLIERDGTLPDQRPASVRTVDAFFQACASSDWDLTWYLLDLRASAVWQGHAEETVARNLSRTRVVSMIRETFPKGLPAKLERVEEYRRGLERVTVRAHWAEDEKRDIAMSWSHVGWRLLVLPEGKSLPKMGKDAKSNQTAPAIDFDSKESLARPKGVPGGGGMGF
jgi:hypothetical protein